MFGGKGERLIGVGGLEKLFKKEKRMVGRNKQKVKNSKCKMVGREGLQKVLGRANWFGRGLSW